MPYDTRSASSSRWPFVEAHVPATRQSEVSLWLIELGSVGVEVRDETTLAKGPGPGMVTLLASFDSRARAEHAQRTLRERDPALDARVDELVGDEWRDKYKEHFFPFALTASITVVPPWIDHVADSGTRILYMDPGRAFGTGLHATTSMVAAALERSSPAYAGARVLDVGTGSGILALVALVMGAQTARAIDDDPDVLEVARENAARNGLAERLVVDDAPLAAIDEQFPMVVCNIEARTLVRLSSVLAPRVQLGGILVLSGVLQSELAEVARAYETRPGGIGLERAMLDVRGEGNDAWVAVTLRRNA